MSTDLPLPDFDLAPLTAFRPEVLAPNRNAADGFILSIAFGYNEIKDLIWLIQQLQRFPSSDRDQDPRDGQVLGMRLNTTRQAIRILHEIIVAIEKAHKDRALDDLTLKEALAAVSGTTRRAWQDLLDIALGKGDEATRQFALLVRNTLAAHYDWKSLLRGYHQCFYEQPREPHGVAYASIGNTMQQTRFFFADAAAQVAVREMWKREPERLGPEVDAWLARAGRAFQNIVEAYLLIKTSRLTSL